MTSMPPRRRFLRHSALEPAWEDLGPWRAPETQTQEEDPGSDLNLSVTFKWCAKLTHTGEDRPADPAWEELGPWRPPEDTPQVPQDSGANLKPVLGCEDRPADPAWEELGPWRPPEDTPQVPQDSGANLKPVLGCPEEAVVTTDEGPEANPAVKTGQQIRPGRSWVPGDLQKTLHKFHKILARTSSRCWAVSEVADANSTA
eukprot:Skav225607  [mRNA]  locus=scaffold3871:84765:87678:+ [translate_table: standard]